MTERELSIIRALGEEFSTVLADLQRTFEGKMASQAQAFEEKLTSLSAVLQKHVTVDEVRPVLQAMVDDAVGAIPVPRDGRDYDPDVLQQAVNDAVANIPVTTVSIGLKHTAVTGQVILWMDTFPVRTVREPDRRGHL